MIKYPLDKELKEGIENKKIYVGCRLMIYNNPITCVNIKENKFIFSFDNIYAINHFCDIEKILKEIYENGTVHGRHLLSPYLRECIDFFFVPSLEQVYYVPEKPDFQFEWFKRGPISRIKADPSGFCVPWFTSTVYENGKSCFIIEGDGIRSLIKSNERAGIPIFFQITKKD